MSEPILSGRYKILKKLGEGGFGQTFLAEDLHLPTKPHCVVKRLKPQFESQEAFKLAHRLFEQEADILYRLGSHPNIPNLLAHFEDGGEFFLVQEFVEGATLAQEFEAGRKYTEAEAVNFLSELLETLSFVHKENVIHRDIKPTNIMRRTSDGKVFLIDFGAVKQASVNPFNQDATFKSTAIIGTSGYAPSEQMMGKPRFSSDLYSAGLLAIQALTGISPLELKNNNVTGEFMWQHKLKLQPDIENFIGKLTRYDFRQRYASAAEAFLALNMVCAKCGIGKRKIKNSASNPPVNPPFVPPTIIQRSNNAPPSQAVMIQPTQDFVPPNQFTSYAQPLQNIQSLTPPKPPKGFFGWLWSSDFAIGAFVIIAVLGLFFVGGFVLVKSLGSRSNSVNQASETATSNDPAASVTDINLMQEAANLAAETEANEKRAKTKPEWEKIARDYRRISTLLAAIGQNDSNYQAAREKILEYQKRAESADKNALIAIDNSSVASSSPLPNQTEMPAYTNGYQPTPTPKPPVATMPPARSDRMYFAYNIAPAYSGEMRKQVVTTDDGDFSASIGDSGVYTGSVTIRVNGGPDSCDVTFMAPHGDRLREGGYYGAQRYPFQSPTKPGMSSNWGVGCGGDFVVNSVQYSSDGKRILLLDATFSQSCGQTVKGRVHYDARYY